MTVTIKSWTPECDVFWSLHTKVPIKSNISTFCLVLLAGRRTTVNSAQDLAVSTSCVTLVHAPLMLWTSGLSSVQSTTASHSGAGITSGSPTRKWTVSLVCYWGLCAKNTEEKKKSSDGRGTTILWTKKHKMSAPFFVNVWCIIYPEDAFFSASIFAKEKQMVCTVFIKTLSLLKINNIFPGL